MTASEDDFSLFAVLNGCCPIHDVRLYNEDGLVINPYCRPCEERYWQQEENSVSLVDILQQHRKSTFLVLQVLNRVEEWGLNGTTVSNSILESILEAMRWHINDVDLAVIACRTLGRCLFSDASQAIRTTLHNANGMVVIQSVMLFHHQQPRVLTMACYALYYLATTPCLQQHMKDCIPMVIQALHEFPDDIDLQSNSLLLLMRLADESNNRQIMGQNQQLLSLVLETMSRHSHESKIQANACGLLANLARESSSILLVQQQQQQHNNNNNNNNMHNTVVTVIRQAMYRHLSDQVVQRNACLALYYYLMIEQDDPQTHPRTTLLTVELILGMMEGVLAAQNRFPSDASIAIHAPLVFQRLEERLQGSSSQQQRGEPLV